MVIGSGNDMPGWLAIDASRQGEVRLSIAAPSRVPQLGPVCACRTDEMPTFTDALMRLEREVGVSFEGLEPALAIAGAVSANTVTIARSRWTISHGGLDALFRRRTTIINEVAARAWAMRGGRAPVEHLRGTIAIDPRRPGRHAMIMVQEGVGGAMTDVDADGAARIIESEVGHTDFAAQTAQEEALAGAIRATLHGAPLTWEHMLMIDRGDAVMATALPGMSDVERQQLLGRMLGRFTVNVMLSSAAWNGVVLTGSRIGRLLSAAGRAGFAQAFEERRAYRRMILATPCQIVQQADPVLTGLAEMLAERQGHRPG
jgi:glucokinase